MMKSKTHQSELERLAALEQQAEIGGSQKAVDRQHQRGKLTARERLNKVSP
jgi:propionyl-CoA carboxylase beta chain